MHYSLSKIRHALRYFLLGKSATALTALLMLALITRALPTQDFAVYVSLQAIVLIIGAVTSFGINQSLIRYVPELRANGNNAAIYRRAFVGIGSRALIIGAACALVAATATYWAPALSLQSTSWSVIVGFMAVGWFRLVERFTSNLFQSLLWQGLSQTVLALSGLIKLAGAAYLLHAGLLTLEALIALELVAELLAVMLLFAGLWHRWRTDPDRHRGDANWWRIHSQRVGRYARWAYLSSVLSVAYGSAPNRLIAARFLAPELVAAFGFADAVGVLVRRFMPAKLLQGLIKPILIARFSERKDFSDLNRKVNLNFRLNSVLLCGLAMLLMTVGTETLDWVTNHKYGSSAPLLAAMLIALLFDGWRAQIELACEVVELPRISLIGNIAVISSLVSAVLLIGLLGVWGLVLASILGQVLSIAVMLYGLERQAYHFRPDLPMLSAPIAALVSGTIGVVALGASQSITELLLGSASVGIIYLLCLLVFKPISRDEYAMIRSLGGAKASRRP